MAKPSTISGAAGVVRGMANSAVFFLKVFPMLPSRPVDWVTKTPVVETARYPTRAGWAEGDLYHPPGPGPHPGIVVCLGVVPFGVDHPQVPVLGRALARSGFAALLYWSPAMRDYRLDPDDVENIAMAYEWLIRQPMVDPARSGLLGTCVGGSFALMAAASPRIRDQVAFVGAYAPYASMVSFALDIASRTRDIHAAREPWQVDPLTRKVFVHSLTEALAADEAGPLRSAYLEDHVPAGLGRYSGEAQAVAALLAAPDLPGAEAALRGLPAAMRARLAALSPLETVGALRAPLVTLLHDRGDHVIPVSESRRLVAALNGRAGVRYTEMAFAHLDPVKGKLPLPRLLRELSRFYRAVYPIFRQAASV